MSFDILCDRVERLLTERLGYQLRSRDRDSLRRFVVQYLARHRSLSPKTYLTLLEEEQSGEWQAILQSVLNPETYFFRDQPQLQVLENKLLTERVMQRRNTRVLRLWSAGCSTGEEAYTLAILCHRTLKRLGENPENWSIDVLGTDINEAALQTARDGLYSNRSFRQMDPELRERWFNRNGDYWQISPALQRLVRFLPLNLNETTRYSPDRQQMDIIVCRNVFLYLLPERVAAIVEGFQDRLTAGGYLLCGHSELPDRKAASLKRHSFPGTVTYQKLQEATLPTASSSVRVPDQASLRAKPSAPDNDELAQAYTYADRGNYEQAQVLCNRLLLQRPLDPALYALKARIAELLGHENEALQCWHKALLLDPRQVQSWIELASLYEQRSDWAAALRHWKRAEDLLEYLPSTQIIGSEVPLTALALQTYVRQAQVKARQNA